MYVQQPPRMGIETWMDGNMMVIEQPGEEDIARQGAYLESLVPRYRPRPEDMPED